MISIRQMNIVYRKELLDGIRDKRAIFTAIVIPLFSPLMIYFLFNAMIDLREDLKETVLMIAGASNAPDLVEYIRQRNVKIVEFEGDADQAIRDKTHNLIMFIPENYASRFSRSKPVSIKLFSDSSRQTARSEYRRAENMIEAYARTIGAMRLMARGVSPGILGALEVREMDMASKEDRSASALKFIPLFVILSAFVCGMGLAIDSTAGERERFSIEALLVNPVKRSSVVLGKWLSASTLAAVGSIVTLIFSFYVMSLVPLEEMGITFKPELSVMVSLSLVMLPLALFASALLITMATFAKSFKDAQSYMGFAILLPMVPFMINQFNPIEGSWTYLIPGFSQQTLMENVMSSKVTEVWQYAASALSALVLSGVLLFASTKLFSGEKIIYNK